MRLAALTTAFTAVPALAIAADASEDLATVIEVLFMTVFMTFFSFAYTCVFMMVPAMFMVVTYTLIVIVLIDLLKRRDGEMPGALEGRSDPNEKLMWLLIVLLTGVVGAVLYHVLVMRRHPLSQLRAATVPPAPPGE